MFRFLDRRPVQELTLTGQPRWPITRSVIVAFSFAWIWRFASAIGVSKFCLRESSEQQTTKAVERVNGISYRNTSANPLPPQSTRRPVGFSAPAETESRQCRPPCPAHPPRVNPSQPAWVRRDIAGRQDVRRGARVRDWPCALAAPYLPCGYLSLTMVTSFWN
jgi:hypothetical protein